MRIAGNLLPTVAIILVGCSSATKFDPALQSDSANRRWATSAKSHPLTRAAKDKHSPWQLDPNQPFEFQIGRGSGFDGLATVKIASSGAVELCEPFSKTRKQMIEGSLQTVHYFDWRITSLTLEASEMQVIINSLNENSFTELNSIYQAGVYDGTQWALLLRQGPNSKTVYCDNHFPTPVTRIASVVDRILNERLLNELRVFWKPIGKASPPHDDDLWKAVKEIEN